MADDPLGLTMTAEGGPGTPGFGTFGSATAPGTAGAPAAPVSRFSDLVTDPVSLVLAKHAQTIRETQAMSPLRRFFGGAGEEAHALKGIRDLLPQVKELRQQQQEAIQNQREYLKWGYDQITKLGEMSPQQQAAAGPLLAGILADVGKHSGNAITPEQAQAMVRHPQTVKQLMGLLGDDVGVSETTGAQLQARLTAIPAKDIEGQRKAIADAHEQAVTQWADAFTQWLPDLLAGKVTTPGEVATAIKALPKPATVAQLRELMRGVAPTILPGLRQSQVAREGYHRVLTDPKYATVLRQMEIRPAAETEKAAEAGAVEEAKIAVTGLPRGPEFNRLATELFPGIAPATLTGSQVAQINAAISERGEKYGQTFNRLAGAMFPNKPIEQLTGPEKDHVNVRVREELGYISAQQGAAQITAGAEAKRKLAFFETHPDHHVVDRNTGQFIDRLTLSMNDIRAAGGEGSAGAYALLDKDETRAYRAILEGKAILDRYADLSTRLAKAPGANLAQRFDFAAKTFLGIENIGVDLSALQGSVLRLAGAMQGSRIQLSDQDRKSVEGMVPTGADTTGTALQRLSNSLAILDVMQQVALGSAPNTKLHKIIAERLTPKRTGPVGQAIP